jgi:hypothetical protein
LVRQSPGRGLKRFVAGRETLEDYINRMQRQASVLTSIGSPLDGGELEALVCMAGYEDTTFKEGLNTHEDQIKFLRRMLACELFDIENSMEQKVRMAALRELMLLRGVEALLIDRIQGMIRNQTFRAVDFNTRIEPPPHEVGA